MIKDIQHCTQVFLSREDDVFILKSVAKQDRGCSSSRILKNRAK